MTPTPTTAVERDTWTESWIPELSRLCLSLAENRPDGKTGKIGSFRSIAELFRAELDMCRFHTLQEVEGLFSEYQKLPEQIVNGQRFLVTKTGEKLPFGYPYPDTREKYALKDLRTQLTLLKGGHNAKK